MNIKTKALVIKEQTIGESDRLVTLLTADYGMIRAFVRNAKQIKSKTASSTALFAYSDFSLYRSREAFVVDNASPIEVFFDLRLDIEKLSLAQYFLQLVFEVAPEEQPVPEMLRLTLNSLHLLCKKENENKKIKAVFEMRLMCLAGFMPSILACKNCNTYETELMYFDIYEGCIYCENCKRIDAYPVLKNVITAIRFICLTEPVKIFSFTLSDENMDTLSQITEKYVLTRIQKKVPTLEFYKSIMKI